MIELFIFLFGIINLLLFLYGLYETKYNKKAFKLSPIAMVFGIFVWGDAVIIGLFWVIISVVSLVLHDQYLFFLAGSLFWVVRSIGEMIYWLNQQYSTLERNPPHKQPYFSIFQNNSIWFANQVFWQCFAVISSVAAIYFAVQWVRYIFLL